MGIKNLMKLIKTYLPDSISNIDITLLKHKKIAIDTNIILYQYITAIRNSGYDLIGPNNKSTSHIYAILMTIINYLKHGIIPIHVIDGMYSDLKSTIIQNRSKNRLIAQNKLNDLLEQNECNKETKIKLLKRTVTISNEDILEVCEIIQLFGLPIIFAPEEADSQCAYMSSIGIVDYVASEDMDILTFGSKNIIKNFMKTNMYIISLDKILTNITMKQFIDICILLGSDYCNTIHGIGYKRAWEFINKYNSIEELILKEKKIINNTYKLPTIFNYNETREYFYNPRHINVSNNDLLLKKIQYTTLKNILIKKYGFKENNINKLFNSISLQIDPFID